MFRIMQGLCPKGYRVIAAQQPPYYTVNEFVLGLDAFLDAVEAAQVHVFGASLGGFLAQQFALHRPKRVASLVLCNSFYSTEPFATTGGTILTPMYQFTPAFVLKNLILSSFTSEAAPQGEGAKPSPVADATDFVVEQLDTLYQGDLASRLTLNCTPVNHSPAPPSVSPRRPRRVARPPLLTLYCAPVARLRRNQAGGRQDHPDRLTGQDVATCGAARRAVPAVCGIQAGAVPGGRGLPVPECR